MIGTGISKHEAEVCPECAVARRPADQSARYPQMLSDAYKKELRRFDLERVLPAWDSLIQKQQEGLAHLQVPTMFATEARTNREVINASPYLMNSVLFSSSLSASSA